MKIKTDDVFIYPTDTVWGIGCSIYSEKGHERIAAIKRTSKDKPLSMMFAGADDILASFSLPDKMSREWLDQFFLLETTLGLPLTLAKIPIPKWATGDSVYVSLRCLNTPVIKSLHDQLKAPFFSTSLNLTGHPPITKTEEARLFQQQYASDTLFIEDKSSTELSGTSSTIIFMKENHTFDILREGRRIEEVKKHLMKLLS